MRVLKRSAAVLVASGFLASCAALPVGVPKAETEPASVTETVANPLIQKPEPMPGPVSEYGGLTIETLAGLTRLSGPVVSPDETKLAFVLRETDFEANRGRTDIWTLDLTTEGAEPVRLTTSEASDYNPVWVGNEELYFLSTRSGSSQIWSISAEGGAVQQLSDYPVSISNLKTLATGRVAFTADVFPACDGLACTAERLASQHEDRSSAQHYSELLVRHWDTWEDGRRSALFTAFMDRGGSFSEPVKVSGDLIGDTPSVPFGGGEEIAASPDGTMLYFALREGGTAEAWSTDLDIYAVPADGSAAPQNLTDGMDGTDTAPLVSPDGTTLIWASMARAGYESDQTNLMVKNLETGDVRNVTEDWDHSVGGMTFSPDSQSVIVSTSYFGTHPLFRIDLEDGKVRPLTEGANASSPVPVEGGVIFAERALDRPVDLYRLNYDTMQTDQLTDVNGLFLSETKMGAYEQFSFEGAEGATVYGYAMKPAGYEAGKTYPLAFIIHGGPQGSYSESWSYRWNPQIYAGAGYAVVFIDFHGSTGYGQDFTDSINQDWGGKPLLDLQLGLAAALERYDWIDGDRSCALGASYGGYMINWIAGNWPDAFDCLVNHDGLFDLRSFYYSTEELWFPERDFGGAYFEVPENYERWNPVNHVDKWQMPMLVIQGELDFRVPPEQSLATFTALQRQGITSELLWFPDENHWVLSPNNSIRWHHTVLDWLDRFTAEEAAD